MTLLITGKNFCQCSRHLTPLSIYIKVQAPVKLTSRIKRRFTAWANTVGAHVYGNGQSSPAGAAQNGGFGIERDFRPPPGFVSGHFPVTFVAGIIFIATGKFDGDDVPLRMPVGAAAVLVDDFSFYDRGIHGFDFFIIFPPQVK